MIRSALVPSNLKRMDEAPARAGRPIRLRRNLQPRVRPIWIHLSIAEAQRLSPRSQLPEYCEAQRCQSTPRRATTFHAVIGSTGLSDFDWVSCADCTGLMIEGTYAT
jgi:hypothetical protein